MGGGAGTKRGVREGTKEPNRYRKIIVLKCSKKTGKIFRDLV